MEVQASPLSKPAVLSPTPSRQQVLSIRSHHIYEGSEIWSAVPEPRIPCDDDPSGLGVPGPTAIAGYVYWTRGEHGPKTKLQAYADSISALMLAVHPLEVADCKAPSPGELDRMRKHQALQKADQARAPAACTIPLAAVLAVGGKIVAAFALRRFYRVVRQAPMVYMQPVVFGFAVGFIYRWKVKGRRKRRSRTLQELAVSPRRWLARVRPFVLHPRRRVGQGPYWSSVRDESEPCGWLNTIISKMWPVYDHPVCTSVVGAVDPILRNVKPPIFLSLQIHRLKFGSRAPEVVSMRIFSASPRRVVLHARVRFVGDDLQAVLVGGMLTGRVFAGIKNLKINAMLRIELAEPVPQPPFFAAVVVSFLEPLAPAFTLRLSTALLPGSVAKSMLTPLLMNILQNKVFATLFVWPNRLVVPMNGGSPAVRAVLQKLQPRIKGLLAVTVPRAALLRAPAGARPVVGFSVDGVHWYKTGPAEDAVSPVWSPEDPDCDEPDGDDLQGFHFLLPLKELDLGLQVAIAAGDIDGSSGWRDRDSDRILARATLRLHQLQEGEVLLGWHHLRAREARTQDGMDLSAAEGHPWSAPWKRGAHDTGAAYMRQPRPEFDRFQESFSGLLGERAPRMPHVPSADVAVRSFRLQNLGPDGEDLRDTPEVSPEATHALGAAVAQAAESIDAIRASATAAAAEVAQVAAAALQKVAASASGRQLASSRDTFRDSTAGELPPLEATPPASPSTRNGRAAADEAPVSHEIAVEDPARPEADASARISASKRGHGSGHAAGPAGNVAPHGALLLSVAMLRASTLKRYFAVSADPARDNGLQKTMEGMAAAQALTRILRPWRGGGSNVVEGQRGCLFVHVHRAYDLNIWSADGGFHGGRADADAYDTYVQLRLASDEDETYATAREARTRIVDNCRSPEYNGEFEFLGERVSQRLQLAVVVTRALEHGRFHNDVMGKASVVLDDLARCPGGKVSRIPIDVVHPQDSAVVTGTLVASLEWIPLNPGPVAPPQRLPLLTEVGRGSFFVRVVCAWDLPPADVKDMSCNARVSILSTGRQQFTTRVRSMCPLWVESFHFEHVSELGEVWLEVQHVGQKVEPVARCRISMADLRHTPNEAVLITKCLTVANPAAAAAADPGAAAALPEDSDTDESETSTTPSTRSGAGQAAAPPPQVPFSSVSRGFSSARSMPVPIRAALHDDDEARRHSTGATACVAAAGAGGASPPQATARPTVSRLPEGAWTSVADPSPSVRDDVSESSVAASVAAAQEGAQRAASARAHVPPGAAAAAVGNVDGSAAARAHPVHNSACGSAMTGFGSLASDAKPPEHVQASGWLMFEVAYRPYGAQAGTRHSHNFTFPPIDKQKLRAESERINGRRQEEFKRAMPDELALHHWSGGFGAFKQSLPVTAAGNRLRVEVLRGTHLPRMDWTGAADPYVVLTAQSEAGLQMFRGATAWDTLTPEWNVTLDIWEAHSTGGHIEVQLWDDDRMRGDDHIATSLIDVGRTLIGVQPCPQQDAPDCTLYPAVPPQEDGADGAPEVAAPLLPSDEVLVRDVLLAMPAAKHRRGVPRVYLRLTWTPLGARGDGPGERQGSPLVPWRPTGLQAMQGLLPAPGTSEVGKGPLRTLSAVAAAEVRRGRLEVTVADVPDGAAASRYPKYVSIRHNRSRLGKTGRTFHCRFNYTAAPMENASVDDVLQFKLKARGLRKELLGHAAVAVADLVGDPTQEHRGVAFSLPLQGAGLMLNVSFCWTPVKHYTASGRPK